MNRIYLDNAATTRMLPEVKDVFMEALETYGNPSSVHSFGREARRSLEAARGEVAEALHAKKEDVYFTSGGTEADNWALIGAARAGKAKGKDHIITSAIEHHGILHTCEALEKEGFRVTYLPVDEDGLLTAQQVAKAADERTALVSVHFANNEIGTLYPIQEIAQAAHAAGALFHTDAVQAVGHVPVDMQGMNIDMLSLSAHKFHGPKGIGALLMNRNVRIPNFMNGGAQERGKRAGTENMPAALAMAKALTLSVESLADEAARLTVLRDRLIHGILATIPETRLNGHPTKRLPGNVNVSVRYIEGEALLLRLDLAGIAASSGSACTSGSLDPSHVLLAIGLPHEIAHGSLRLSLSRYTTQEEVDHVLVALPEIVQILRNMSPLYAKTPFNQIKGDAQYV